MPAITPLPFDIDSGFTARKEAHSDSGVTITTASGGTVLAQWGFENTEVCDVLAVASVNAFQSGNITTSVSVSLWIELDDVSIGDSVIRFGAYINPPTVVNYLASNLCVGVAKDVSPGQHTLTLRGRSFPSGGSPTVTADVREFQSIEFYR